MTQRASRLTSFSVGALLAGCQSDACCFHEGERLEVTIVERTNSFRGSCVPVDVGDSFTLEVGEIHEACWNHEPDDVACKRAPLRGLPEFARPAISACSPHPDAEPLALRCRGEATQCTPTMDLALSPILERDSKGKERGYLVVRWNLRDGAYDDQGVFTSCLEGCEESFRVRIELLDR